MKKKQKYDKCILQVQNRSLAPLDIFSIIGGMTKETNECFSEVIKTLSEKRDERYLVMMLWIRRKTSF